MKTKNNKKFLGAIVTIIMIFAIYSFFPGPFNAKAVDSIRDASDTISDSDVSATAVLHTFDMLTTTAIPAGGTIQITFGTDFPVIAANGDIDCDTGGVASGASSRTAICTYAAGLAASTTRTITVDNMTNPSSEGYQTINIVTYNGTTVLDRVQVMVYIINDVLMTATVDATLTFSIEGLDSGEIVNGVTCTATTTATTTPFGTLSTTGSTTVCQQLKVGTNADDGFSVTVQQDQELTSDSGSNINSFNNSPTGSGSTTPQAWTGPAGILDNYDTYGHMGLTSEDSTLSTGDFFGDSLYVGFNGSSSTVEVFYHNGPADGGMGNTPDKGLTQVAYTAEIMALQEAGDYESTLTYVATPTY